MGDEELHELGPERATDLGDQPPKVKKTGRVKPYAFDLENLEFTMTDKFGEFNGSIAFLPAAVIHRLAMHGAVALLHGRNGREKRWEQIKQGDFDRKQKKVPIVVQAYANIKKIGIDAALAEWAELDNKTKYEVRGWPQIKMEVARLQGGDKPLDQPAG
jgi:hypothetical protein